MLQCQIDFFRKLWKRGQIRLALAVIVGLGSIQSAQGVGLTYVDGEHITGVPNLSPDNVYSLSGTATVNNMDNLWWYRGFGAVNSSNIQSVYEAGVSENAPMLTMTVSGLTPGSSYDMYALYWSDTTGNWRAMAGTAPASLQLFNKLGPAAAIPTAIAGNFASSAAWDVPPKFTDGNPLFTDGNRTAYIGKAGTAVADASGNVLVYIDDSANSGSTTTRTFWDGVAYVPADTPVFVTATIDRTSGLLSITNTTTQNFTIKSYTMTSAAGALNATAGHWAPVAGRLDSNGNGTFDNDPWAVTAPANPALSPFATALTEGATAGTGGLLAASGGSLALGNAWNRTPFQDVSITLTLDTNATITISPTYIGAAANLGDFNGSGGPANVFDYQTLMANIHTNVSSLAVAEAYARGDINLDRAIDYYDFSQFAFEYDQQNGAGAFASIPEPTSAVLLLLGGTAMAAPRIRKQIHRALRRPHENYIAVIVVMGLSIATAIPGSAMAAPVVDWAVDPLLNVATVLTNQATNSPTIGDGSANNADNVGIVASIPQVNLTSGQQITLSGSVVISGGLSTASATNGFRYGLFQENGAPPGDTAGWLGYIAENSTAGRNGNISSKNPAGTGFAEATWASTTQGRAKVLALGGNPATFQDGTYQFSLTVGRFDDNTTTSYTTLTSGAGYSMGVYRATETDPSIITFGVNRVGILAASVFDGDQFAFSNIDVTVAPITAATLKVTATGGVQIVNTTGAPLDLKYYEITSAAGALSTAGWTTIDSTEGGDPVGTGWDPAVASSSTLLSEGNLQGAKTLAAGASISLGNAAVNSPAHDLRFYYGLPDGSTYRGLIQYVTAHPGDFDSDGDVDGADFVAWQTNFPKANGATLAQGDADGDGDVDGADFVVWQTNFPFTPGPGTSPVPEPAAGLIGLVGIAAIALLRWRVR
jgi:hypothetical protein